MKRLIMSIVAFVSLSVNAYAAITVYTDETAYINALNALSYGTFTEDFEGAAWSGVRTPVAGNHVSAPSVTSNGITWSSTVDQSLIPAPSQIGVTTSTVFGNNYFIFSSMYWCPPLSGCSYYHVVRDTLIGDSSSTLYGVGGWIRAAQGRTVYIYLDNSQTSAAEIMMPDNDYHFLGVIETNGFQSFTITELESEVIGGTINQQILFWADDFTFSSGPPSPPIVEIAVTDSITPNDDRQLPFGTVNIGTNATAQVTVSNTGTAELEISGIAQSNSLGLPFSQTHNCPVLPQTLAPGGNCTISVNFDPVSALPLQDSFDISSNDPTTPVVTISVSGTGNTVPTAMNDAIFVAEGYPVLINVVANDSDPDGDTITVSAVSQGINGIVVDNGNGTVTYTHNGSETLTDSFTYTISDGRGGSDTATVSVSVTPINDDPVAGDDAWTVAEGDALNISAPGLLTNDSDAESNPLSVSTTPVSEPVNGTLILGSDGSFSYSHDGTETVSDSFIYEISDGNGGTDQATVSISITPQNDPPIANNDSATVNEGGTVAVLDTTETSVLVNDTDGENDPLSAVLNTGPSNGSVLLNQNGTFSYTHNGSETTSDSFTYIANDGSSNSNIATVSISVISQNDVPTAVNDGYNVNEDSVINVTAPGVLGNDSDPDSPSLSVILVTGVANGILTLNSDGSFSYAPNADFNGTDSFTYRANDGFLNSDIATVTISVDPVNDPPVANDQAVTTGINTPINISLSAGDVDGDPLVFTITVQPINGSLSGAPPDVTYTPGTNFSGQDTFTFEVDDGNAGVDAGVITITVVNDLSLMCLDGGTIECLERVGGGSDSDNIVSTYPKIDEVYEFSLTVTDNSGLAPQYVRLFMTQKGSPLQVDFYGYDMTCTGNIVTGSLCSYVTGLGPAAIHLFYFEAMMNDGTVLRYPETGYLTGPSIHLLSGYSLVGAPRDLSGASLDGAGAFGSTNTYRWDAVMGYYSKVTSTDPVISGEGYYAFKTTETLPELNYVEIAAPDHTYELVSGWNIISNPYSGNVPLTSVMIKRGAALPVSWVEAVTNGWLENAIYYFQGSDWGGTYSFDTEPSAVLVPWLGFWIHLNVSDDVYYVIIPKPSP